MKHCKLILDDEIILMSKTQGITINDALLKKYSDEISYLKSKDDFNKNLSPFKILMRNNGFDGNTLLKDFTTNGASDWMLPAFLDTQLREWSFKFPTLNYLTTNIVNVPSRAIIAAYLDLNDSENRIDKARVAEGADLPLAQIKIGENSITCYKHGRAVQATYEAIQYLQVNIFSKVLQYIAADVTNMQFIDGINVILNGDGNSLSNGKKANKPERITLNTENVITQEDLINVALEFYDKSQLPITTIVVNKEFYTQLFKLQYDTSMTGGVMAGFGLNFPQSMVTDVNVIYDSRVPTSSDGKQQMIVLNNEQALSLYTVAGSQIQEYDRNIRNQTQIGTISQIAGFGKFNPYASMVAY